LKWVGTLFKKINKKRGRGIFHSPFIRNKDRGHLGSPGPFDDDVNGLQEPQGTPLHMVLKPPAPKKGIYK
jgi:hypothetical protein